MLACQRHQFDIPRDVAYFNCGYMGPLTTRVRDAGYAGVRSKSTPWTIQPHDFFTEVDAARNLFARLLHAEEKDIAVAPSVSYAMAVAARNLPILPGQSVLVLAEQFPSNVYCWRALAARAGADVTAVPAPEDGDWTAAVLAAITARTAIAALPHCHWSNGALLDLPRVAERCREVGAALALDLTQSAGVLPFDVRTVAPDFAVSATYKWLLGPYSLAFMYVAPRWQEGEPIEHNWITREGSEDFAGLVNYRDALSPGASRYDMGERSNLHLMPMAVAALEQTLEWGVEEIRDTLGAINFTIAERCKRLGIDSLPEPKRAPHFLSLRFAFGMPFALAQRLAAEGVSVSVRGDYLRITPHVHIDEQDIQRLLRALAATL